MLNAPGLLNLLAAFANYRKARCNHLGCDLNIDENGCGSSVIENVAGVSKKLMVSHLHWEKRP